MQQTLRRSIALLAGLLALTLCLPQPAAQATSSADTVATTRYVATSGSDSGNNCTSSAAPCQSIQRAVNQSVSGDTIRVAGGTYTYNASEDVCTTLTNRAIVCVMNKSLTILGGYTTTDWSTAWAAVNVTTLDGLNVNRGVAVIGYPSTTFLDMEGFTITRGRASDPTSPGSSGAMGGGMLVQKARVTLRDLILSNNQAIGADTGSGHGGKADGAAIRIQDGQEASGTSLLQRITITNNQSLGGDGSTGGGIAFGALYIYNSPTTIEDSSFSGNSAIAGNAPGDGVGSDGLRADALGGGLAIQNSIVTANRIMVNDNHVTGGNAGTGTGCELPANPACGGGAYGGGVFIEETNTSHTTVLNLTDAIISDNTADAGNAKQGGIAAGGGLDSDSSQVIVNRTRFLANTATGGDGLAGGNAGIGSGGGMNIFAIRAGVPRSTFTNILVADNFAYQGGGVGNAGNGGGGGMVAQGVGADITHATFARNGIGTDLFIGQALEVEPWIFTVNLPADVTLNYSIIADHTHGQAGSAALHVQDISGIHATLTLNYGLFSGNWVNTINWGTLNTPGPMTDSPSPAGFMSPGSPNYNYHLRSSSPAVDQATGSGTNEDFEGQSRPYNSIRDFGADEYWPFGLHAGIGDGSLRLDWAAGVGYLAGGVDHYKLVVTCPPGASPPDGYSCPAVIATGSATHLFISGLSNGYTYSVIVRAYDAADAEIATSFSQSATPRGDLQWLPTIRK